MRRFTQSLLGQVMLSMAAALLIAQGKEPKHVEHLSIRQEAGTPLRPY